MVIAEVTLTFKAPCNWVTGIPSAPRGVPRINVTFQLDVNGLLSVSAREEQSGQEQSIRIEGASTLSRDDVSKMLKEAEENAVFDKAKKGVINITYELDNLFTKIENLLDKNLPVDKVISKTLAANLNCIKFLYNSKSLTQIESKNYLNQLNYSLNVFIFDFLSKELNSQSSQKTTNKGVVIDVTEE